MADIQVRGLRFHVQRLPAKASARVAAEAAGRAPGRTPTTVLIHGLAVDNLAGLYATLGGPLAESGSEALLYDLRGHGLSERPRTGYTLADSVADLAALLDTLGLREPVHLVGNSYGGAVALAFALAHPQRVAGLAVVEGYVPVAGWGARMARLIGELTAERRMRPLLRQLAVRAPGLDEAMARRARGLFASTSVVADLAATPPVTAEQLRSLRCPVLAVYGERSDILAHGRHLAATVPGCELRVVPDGGHFLLLTDGPAVRDLVLEWVARTTTAPAVTPAPAAAPLFGVRAGG